MQEYTPEEVVEQASSVEDEAPCTTEEQVPSFMPAQPRIYVGMVVPIEGWRFRVHAISPGGGLELRVVGPCNSLVKHVLREERLDRKAKRRQLAKQRKRRNRKVKTGKRDGPAVD